MSKKYNSIQAFTLVELIVVITLLIILGTLAFMSYIAKSSETRDATRAADINTLSKAINMKIDAQEIRNISTVISSPLIHNTFSSGTVLSGSTLNGNIYGVGTVNNKKFAGNTFIDPSSGSPFPFGYIQGSFGSYYQVAASLEDGSALVQ